MIEQVMDSINNHFVRDFDVDDFEIVSDGIVGSFSSTYLIGMYVLIKHSLLNDGVYEITGVTDDKITVDATLKAENTGESIVVYALTPKKSFLDLVTEIETFVANDESVGVASESLGDYSVSYGKEGSWQSVFRKKLNTYRKVYSDLDRWYYEYK